MKLRIRSGLGYQDGSDLPSFVDVEWVGRAGHPSSYGLLGGMRSPSPQLKIWNSSGRFKESLAGSADQVFWGLPNEYESAVDEALTYQASAIRIGTAAHGVVGSSSVVFGRLTFLLGRLLGGGVPAEDHEIWRLLDSCWNAA